MTLRDVKALSLRRLAAPLYVENLLRILLALVDTWQIGMWNSDGVAAMGLASQFLFFVQLMFQMVALGASILISQNLGAGRVEEARRTAAGAMILTVGFGVVIGVGLAVGAGAVVGLYALDKKVAEYSIDFLVIFGIGSLTTGLSILFATFLRVWGHTRTPMLINIGASLFNVLGNAFVLFGWFGAPILGVAGVALMTGLAQGLAAFVLWIMLRRKDATRLGWRDLRAVRGDTLRGVLAIGVPTAGENLSYSLAQIANMRVIAMLGTEAMTAYVYILSWLRFVFTPAQAIGWGTQTKVGWWVGSGDLDVAYRRALKWFGIGAGISVFLVSCVYFFQRPLMGVYTTNPRVLALASSVFVVSLFHEPGRNFNIILIPALKGAGDVRFPVTIGVVFNWILGVGGSWVLGVVLGLGLPGVWIALASDEWVRGLTVFLRWKSGRWRTKILIK